MTNLRQALSLLRSWAAYAAAPAAGIITAPILAHALGPSGRGQLAGILQPLTLASAVAAIGVPAAVTYFISRGANSRKVVQLALKISLAMTAFVSVGLLFYSGAISERLGVDRIHVVIIWSAFIPSAFIAIRRSHLQGLRYYHLLDLERFIWAGLRVALFLLMLLVGVESVIVFAAAYMVTGLLASTVLRFPKGATEKDQTGPNGLPAKRFVAYTMLSAFGTIAATMSARLDQALMPAVVTAKELGYYSVAVSVAEIATIITAVITRNVLAEVASGSTLKGVVLSIVLGGVAQTILSIGMVVLFPYVLPYVFGEEFVAAMGLIRILVLSTFIAYWSGVGSAFLSGSGRPGLGSASQAIAAGATLVLFWFYWERMDSIVAAWISVAGQGSALAMTLLLIYRIRRMVHINPAESK